LPDLFGIDQSTCSSEESPANPGPSLENRLAMTMNEIYGLPVLKRLRNLNRPSSSSKMSPGLFQNKPGHGVLSQTWRDWATGLRQVYSLRKKLARTIFGNEYLLWHTPHGAGNVDHKGKVGSGGEFAKQVVNWPTVTAPRGVDNHKKNRQSGADDLPTVIANWVTPSSRDWKDTSGMSTERPGGHRIDQLPRQVHHFPDTPQDETTSSVGLLLQVWTPPSCPRLNGNFAEWLMGWPPGLTAFGLSETGWTHWWQRTRSSLFTLVSLNETEEI